MKDREKIIEIIKSSSSAGHRKNGEPRYYHFTDEDIEEAANKISLDSEQGKERKLGTIKFDPKDHSLSVKFDEKPKLSAEELKDQIQQILYPQDTPEDMTKRVGLLYELFNQFASTNAEQGKEVIDKINSIKCYLTGNDNKPFPNTHWVREAHKKITELSELFSPPDQSKDTTNK